MGGRAITRPPTGVVATIAIAVFVSLIVLGFVISRVVWGAYSFRYYSRDPAATLDALPLVGVLSHAGVLIAWGAASVAVFAGALVLRARGWRDALPLVAIGAGTGWLALDDLFRFHEDVFQRAGVEQEIVFIAYGVGAVAVLWWGRDVFRAHEWPLLALASAALGASLVLDQELVDLGADVSRWVEDALKLLGLALLALYLVRLAARMFMETYPEAARSRPSGLPWRTLEALFYGVVRSVVVVTVGCVLILAAVGTLAAASEQSFRYFTRDPASTLSASPFVGVLTNVGVLFAWGAAAVSVFAGLLVARAVGWRRVAPLLGFGAGIGYLALDDLLMLHDGIYEDYLGLNETLVVLAYAVLALAFVWWYRRFFRQNEWPLLGLALTLLACAFVLDFDDSASFRLAPLGFEDSAKLFGLALVSAYLVRLSARMLADAYPLQGPPPVSIAERFAAEPSGVGAHD